MPVQLTTADLIRVSFAMNRWSNEMRNLAQQMRSKVSSMQQWQDAQAVRFKEAAESTASGLMIQLENLDKISIFLKRYGNRLEEAEREQSRRMNNINQR